MSVKNTIRCKFCKWTTHLWGNDSTPEKAFRRLRLHIEGEHPTEDERLDQKLEAWDADHPSV